MGQSKKILLNTGYLYVKMFFSFVFTLMSTRILLSSLGTTDYGIFGVIAGAVAMLGFFNASLANSVQRFMSYYEGKNQVSFKKNIYNIAVVQHIVAGAAICGLLFLLKEPAFLYVLRIPGERIEVSSFLYITVVITTFISIITVPYDAVLNSHENMLIFSYIGIVNSFMQLLAAFFVKYYDGDKLELYGILIIIIQLITLMIESIYCKYNYEECVFHPYKYLDYSIFKSMLKFSLWNLFSNVTVFISANSQTIIINYFFGVKLNAAQNIANQVNSQMQALSKNLLKAINPVIVKSEGAGNRENLLAYTFSGLRLSTILYLIIAIPVFIACPSILKLWLETPPEWSIIFVRLVLIQSFFDKLYSTIITALYAEGNIKYYTIWCSAANLFQIPIAIIAFIIGSPPYIIYLISICFGNVLAAVISLIFANRNLGMSLSDYFNELILPVSYSLLPAFFIVSFVHAFVVDDTIGGVAFISIFSVSIYAILVSLLSLNKKEKKIMYDVILRIIKR